jgi:tight adherence protein C
VTQEQLFLLCLAGGIAFIGYGLCRLFVQKPNTRLEQRLQDNRPPGAGPRHGPGSFSALVTKIGQTAGKSFQPRTAEEQSALRKRLSQAGIYTAAAAHMFSGTRAIALAAGLLGGYFLSLLVAQPALTLLFSILGAIVGYLLPTLWLSMMISGNHKTLERGLPDALDLMVVCVEAGLTVDAALQRVGREINLAHPALARELAITHLEAQMGLPRAEALRNLASRTGSDAIQSLTAMLIQAERFGTGIAQALRIHAESLRIKRQYAAEERASQAAVKMTVPLVLCIFPAMLIVVGAPAVIRMMYITFK